MIMRTKFIILNRGDSEKKNTKEILHRGSKRLKNSVLVFKFFIF